MIRPQREPEQEPSNDRQASYSPKPKRNRERRRVMAVRMYERKHEHDGGSIVARVVERDNARYDVIVKVYALDGSELTLAAGSVITEGQFETLAEAQRA